MADDVVYYTNVYTHGHVCIRIINALVFKNRKMFYNHFMMGGIPVVLKNSWPNSFQFLWFRNNVSIVLQCLGFSGLVRSSLLVDTDTR